MLWSDFQHTADRLIRGSTEGDWRSAVSRTYYAVFHYFREFFLSHGVDIGRSGVSHNNLCIGLLNSGSPAVVPFSRRVDDLRLERTAADYNLVVRIAQGPARDAVDRGRAIPVDFQSLLGPVPGTQIAGGVRRYLQSIGRIP
jgi:hypothetical protein